MAEQSQPEETPRAGSQFGRSTRRRFLSRLGMASLLASAGPVLGERSRDEAAAIPQKTEATPTVEGAIPVSLRVNGEKYDLRIDPRNRHHHRRARLVVAQPIHRATADSQCERSVGGRLRHSASLWRAFSLA